MDSVSPDSGRVYNLQGENGSSIHYVHLQSGDMSVIGNELTALPPQRAIMSAAILANCDMVVAARVGWVSIRHRTPAKPASSHTAISANLPLCANNSADVLAFWRSFATLQACLVCAMPQQPAIFSVPITEGTVELKSAGVLLLSWNGCVIEGRQVTGFSIT